MSGKRLGELLIEAGFINKEQLNHALNEQKISKEKLGQTLMRLGYITEDIFFEFNKDLRILTGLIEAVHKSSSLEEIYRVALDSVIELENIDMAMIYLIDEEKQEAVLQAHRNITEDYIRRASRIPYPKGITWKVINTGNMINIEDAQKDPDTGPAGRDLGHHSNLGIPIFLEGRVIGVIWFGS